MLHCSDMVLMHFMKIKIKTGEIDCKLKQISTFDTKEKYKIDPWKLRFQGQTGFVEKWVDLTHEFLGFFTGFPRFYHRLYSNSIIGNLFLFLLGQ